MPCFLQTLSEVEDSLKEFEQRLSELKSRAEGPRSDKISNQELLKLQVTVLPFHSMKSIYPSFLTPVSPIPQ